MENFDPLTLWDVFGVVDDVVVSPHLSLSFLHAKNIVPAYRLAIHIPLSADGLVACSRPGLCFRAPERHIVVLEDYKSLVRPANRGPLSPELHVILPVFRSSALRADGFARSLATRPSSQGPRLCSPVLTSAFPTLAATRYVSVRQLATCSLHYRVHFSGPAL